jgi:hypothetical protein
LYGTPPTGEAVGVTSPHDPIDSPATSHAPLTERQRALIEFEGSWWQHDGVHDQMVRARFGCGLDEYYRDLYQLLDHPDALSVDPLVVRRLRRSQERRRRARLDGAPGRTGEQGGTHA